MGNLEEQMREWGLSPVAAMYPLWRTIEEARAQQTPEQRAYYQWLDEQAQRVRDQLQSSLPASNPTR